MDSKKIHIVERKNIFQTFMFSASMLVFWGVDTQNMQKEKGDSPSFLVSILIS